MIFNEKRKKLTARQFDEEVARLIEWVQGAVSPFTGDTKAKQEARVRRAREDQDYFNQTYLPHYFNQESPSFHAEMEELIAEGQVQQRPVIVAAPRGHAKSTRVTFAHTLREVLYKITNFTLIISDTETQAKGLTISARVELEHNPRIIHDFGAQKTGQWAAGDFVVKAGPRVMARGDGQGVRGLKHGPHRPDRAKVDDIESDESVRNPARIKQTLAWIMEAVVPSLDPARGVLFVVGTLLSKRSVLAKLIENPAVISKIYRAIAEPVWDDGEKLFISGAPLWPERFSLERLSKIRNLIGSISFNKEYQNDPRDDEGLFQEQWIESHRYKWDAIPSVPLYTYQGIDPSLKQGQSNDFKANITASRGDPSTGSGWKIYCRHAWIKKCSIDQMVKSAYILHARFVALQVGLETEGWQVLLRRELDREAERQKRYLPIVPIERKGVSKEDETRIGGLSPLIENGILVFPYGPESEIGDIEVLIEQLIYFPSSSVHDDGPDALEIAVHLAEKRAMSKPSYERVAQREARFEVGAF